LNAAGTRVRPFPEGSHAVSAATGFTFGSGMSSTGPFRCRPGNYQILHKAPGFSHGDIRRKHSQRGVPAYVAYLQARGRKRVETAGSLLARLWPKSIHAVTPQGFELKVMLFILAYSVSCAV
jgi:hypothetical protein